MIWRIRRLGYVRKLAESVARFFCVSEILVWAVAEVLAVLPESCLPLNTGPANTGCECPAGYYYAPFGIQR